MTQSSNANAPSFQIIRLYLSRQFFLYIVFGLVATTAQISTRYALNLYLSFSIAVLLSYFVGMLVAFFLYRRFVFDGRREALRRQAMLFMAAYLAFLPVTWGLSVGTARPLVGVLPPDRARLVAHLIGVGVPVVLNFAFNKLVTFRRIPDTTRHGPKPPGPKAPQHWAGWRMHRPAAVWAIVILIGAYALTVAAIGISGDFPLNDDWAYASTTRDFVRTGVFTPSNWSSVPLLSEVLFAAPFCAATACGADDLRVATLIASVVLSVATFALVRTSTRSSAIPILAAASVAFNPVAYTLAFTFMSDMLFAALMTVGAILFIRSLQRDSVSLAVVGTAIALAATLTRQLGLCLPLAYLAVSLVQMIGAGTWRRRAIPSLVPLAVCGAGLTALKQWLRLSGRLPALYDIKSSIVAETLHSPLASLMRVGHNVSIIVCYTGLFALPMLIATWRSAASRASTRRALVRVIPRLAGLAAAALATVDLVSLHRLMPSGGNILVPQGVGPLLLRDTAILGLSGVPPLPLAFWVIVTLLSLLGAFLLVEHVAGHVLDLVLVPASSLRRRASDPVHVRDLFVATAALAYVAPLLLIPFYDRYLVPLLPLTFALLASGTPPTALLRWRAGFATALSLLVSVYAVLSVHDYMAWNRARWTAIADLETSRGIGPNRIDGGMEYNGLRAYRPGYAVQAGKSWWWVDGDDYQITFDAVTGLDTVGRYPYATLLPPAERSIKVLMRPK